MRAAEVYALKLGWRVLPLHDVASGACSCGRQDCPSAGKHPRIKAWEQEATTDAAVIADWWARYPSANVGIATGSPFFVLDVDPENGGVESLAALIAQHGPLPETAQARTGSGGTHYLFNAVPGARNTASKIGPGLDTRGSGGQIVVAPSVSAKGKYTWIAAPWRTPIADAPAWLLAALARAPTPSAAGASATERGYFPPASPAVLAAAAEALERHGPAIDGQGGGLHSVRAGMILAHDFALSEEEAFPLLEEWNATCSPPWELDALRGVLDRGRKYGKADYGARRSMDAIDRANKLIRDWEAGPRNESTIDALRNDIAEIAEHSGSKVNQALIEAALVRATGLSAKDLSLPKPRITVDPPQGSIELSTRIHETADHATLSIAPAVFARNGVLCEVVKAERTFISDLETPRIQDLMSQQSKYHRVDEKTGNVTISAPLTIAALLHSRRSHAPAVRVLEAITTAPIFLADGSILCQRGYNAKARVFLEPSVSVDVPDDPTLDDAVAAVAVFRDLLCDFHFADPADFSSWLAGLLSPLVKAATANAPSPLICVSAPSAGSGKTMLIDVIARIVTGAAAEVRPYNPRDPAEWGKRLTAFVKAASPVSVFDNCNGMLGDEGLDRLITSATWSDRILGASEAPPLPNVTTWFATGNNIEPVGDTVRRVLVCRIEVDTDRPQERSDFKHDPLIDYASAHRSEFLTAALTLLSAYHCAGRPNQSLASWGSFTTWSELIRGALVWAGCADPFVTQRRAALDLNEPENEAHDYWLATIDGCDGSIAAIVTVCARSDAQAVLGLREAVNTHSLPKLIRRFVDKPRAGRRIRKDPDSKAGRTRYYVEMIR